MFSLGLKILSFIITIMVCFTSWTMEHPEDHGIGAMVSILEIASIEPSNGATAINSTLPQSSSAENSGSLVHYIVYDSCLDDIEELLRKNHLDVSISGYYGRKSIHLIFLLNDKELLSIVVQAGRILEARKIVCFSEALYETLSKEAISLASSLRYNLRYLLTPSKLAKTDVPLNALDNDPTHSNYGDELPLHRAALSGDEELIRLLIDNGMPLDVIDQRGFQAIHRAVEYGQLNIVKVLVDKGARIDAQVRRIGWQPIHIASRENQLEMIQWLLEHGADINAWDGDGDQPAHHAARQGNREMIRFLLEHGARVATKCKRSTLWRSVTQPSLDSSSIHYAALQGDLERVRFLVEEQGVSVSEEDRYGAHPIHYAMESGQGDLVMYLINKDAYLLPSDHNLREPLFYALAAGRVEMLEKVKNSYRCWRILTRDGFGETPITYAFSYDPSICNLASSLICRGQGIRLMYAAAKGGCRKVLENLVASGEDITVCDDNGLQALHYAAAGRYGKKELIDWLITVGGDINAQDARGWTALHHAVHAGDSMMVDFLLEKGAKPNIRSFDSDGNRTADKVINPETAGGRGPSITKAILAAQQSYGERKGWLSGLKSFIGL